MYRNRSGVIALLGVIVVGAVSVVIIVSMLLLGVGSAKTGIITEKSWQAKSLANACGEEALQKIRDDITYLQNGQMVLAQGTCNYEIYQTDQYIRSIHAWGTVDQSIIRKLLMNIDINPSYPVVNIILWQEVADF